MAGIVEPVFETAGQVAEIVVVAVGIAEPAVRTVVAVPIVATVAGRDSVAAGSDIERAPLFVVADTRTILAAVAALDILFFFSESLQYLIPVEGVHSFSRLLFPDIDSRNVENTRAVA